MIQNWTFLLKNYVFRNPNEHNFWSQVEWVTGLFDSGIEHLKKAIEARPE